MHISAHDRKGNCGEHRHAAAQAVDPIGKIDRIDHSHNPQQGNYPIKMPRSTTAQERDQGDPMNRRRDRGKEGTRLQMRTGLY